MLLNDLLEIIRVAVVGAGHEDHVALTLFNGTLNDVGILETAGRADDRIDTGILQCLGVLQRRGILLREDAGAGMLAIASGRADVINIHVCIPDFQHLDPLGIKGCSDLHGNQEIRAAQGANPLEQLCGGTAAVFQTAAVLVGTGVVCAYVADGGDLHHVKAQTAIFQRVVGDILNPVLKL